ncbi:MAG: porin [Caldimonas sp.]
MRRHLAAAALAAALPVAQGQSISAFGLIDVAVEHVTRVGSPPRNLNRMPSATGSLPSRIGFRGSEDLGDGLRAVFVIEQGFAPDQGTFNQGGRAWGRQALVGFTGPWGSLTIGRQYTMLYWSILDADILGTNIYGSGSLDAYIPNARADNAIVYRGTFSGVTIGASYSVGRDAASAGNPAATHCAGESTDRRECREWSALAKYDGAAWGAAIAIDEIRGGPGAFAGLTSSALKDTRLSINGYVDFTNVRLAGGVIRRDNEANAAVPRSDLWYVGTGYAATPLVKLEFELFRLDSPDHDRRATLAATRATYSLSKRSALYATAGRILNGSALAISVSGGAAGSNPLPGSAQSGLAAGFRHSF